eukprot:GHRQ01020743.1.p1 GENE.GHRQ01020743.1~~GHRQ01020743.1.p1  ORF type:complete len:225 (-),score=84.91 GHRQ01020743.1:344-1018(-)
MSGMYTAVHCICQRIRMVEDGWNRGIAGCSTGLVLGWKAGPWSALQSCAGIGLLSALIDLGGGAAEAAQASMLGHLQQVQREQRAWQEAAEADALLPQLAALLASPWQQQQTRLQLAADQPNDNSSRASSRQPLLDQQHWIAAVQAAAGPLPAAAQQLNAAAQQLVSAMPPLAFLSTCCSGGPVASLTQPSAVSSAGLSEHAVDACLLARADEPLSSKPGRRAR